MAGYDLTVPLETDRLVLRAFTPEDFDALHTMRSSPEVARYLIWEPQSEAEVREALARKVASRSLRSEGDVLALAAEDRSTGTLVADVILHWASEEHALGEIGYVVPPAHVGRGYATEATRPLLEIAFEHLALHRVIARLDSRNEASARVLEKLGLRLEAHLVESEFVKGEWQSELIYAILDREWHAGRAPTRGTR